MRFPKNKRPFEPPKMRISAQFSLVNRHKMHSVYQPPIPKQNPNPNPPQKSQVSRAKSLPSQQSPRRKKRRVFDIHRGFDQGGKQNQKKTKMRPGCHLAALARLFGTWTRRSTRLQEAFSWEEQLVAHCNPDFSRVKEIRKTKASVREKELQSRKESQKAPASLCCAPESRLKRRRSIKASQNAKCAVELLQAE